MPGLFVFGLIDARLTGARASGKVAFVVLRRSSFLLVVNFLFDKPTGLFVVEEGLLLADEHIEAQACSSYFERSRPSHIKHTCDFELAPIFPYDGKWHDAAVFEVVGYDLDITLGPPLYPPDHLSCSQQPDGMNDVVAFDVDICIRLVEVGAPALNAGVAESTAQAIYCVVERTCFEALLLYSKEIELAGL